VAEPRSSKPYRVYRGGRVSADDPEARRFDFGESGGTRTRTRTPPGMPPPPMRPTRRERPLPGKPVAGATAPPPRRRRRIGWVRGVLLALGLVVVAFGVWGYLGYRSFSNEVKNANARVGRHTRRVLAPSGNILFNPQITLIMGSDSRGAGSGIGQRADSILLMRSDPGKHTISMLSIPRDLRVPIPGVGEEKINAAFADGGPSLLIRTVDRLTGFRINHVVIVDFTGFKDLVDALGGVSFYNPTKVFSSQPFDGIMWHFPKGTVHLDGRRALAYARIRHTTNPADSDITRTERQQRVLQALARKLVSPSSVLHLPSVGAAIAKPLATDFSANELLGLGWIWFRKQRTVKCHLGGTPEVIGGEDVLVGSEQNRAVVGMFLGKQAPQPPPKGELYAPGCGGG
jgi:polyisoprenyl-teichoic acid--peptidoglycan teichoic acid transferase